MNFVEVWGVGMKWNAGPVCQTDNIRQNLNKVYLSLSSHFIKIKLLH